MRLESGRWPCSPPACVHASTAYSLCFVIQPAILVLQLPFSSRPCTDMRGMHCWARFEVLFSGSRLPPDPAAARLSCIWAVCLLAAPSRLVGRSCTCIQGAVLPASCWVCRVCGVWETAGLAAALLCWLCSSRLCSRGDRVRCGEQARLLVPATHTRVRTWSGRKLSWCSCLAHTHTVCVLSECSA
jgi:hypothetical protein